MNSKVIVFKNGELEQTLIYGLPMKEALFLRNWAMQKP